MGNVVIRREEELGFRTMARELFYSTNGCVLRNGFHLPSAAYFNQHQVAK